MVIHILCTWNCLRFCVGVLSERNVWQCVVCTVCVVSRGSPTKWLVISSALDLQFSNTHVWCKEKLICNIKHFAIFKNYFVCLLRERQWQTDWVKESVCLGSVTSGPHLLDSWCASPSSLFMPKMKPGSDVEENVWSPELVWMIWLCCAPVLIGQFSLPCVLLPAEMLSVLIRAGRVWF